MPVRGGEKRDIVVIRVVVLDVESWRMELLWKRTEE
jgi:hypothetical protein